ncbi:MAG: cupredoxin domain-containing protein [Actinomycetota bacterium]
MPKRVLIASITLGLLGAACVSSSTPPVDYGVGARFVPFVVDATDDMGQGDAVGLTADGLPYVAYFGFPAELAQGEIAIPRPFGSPAVPGVMLATGSSEGIWQRGAVNTNEPDLKTSGVSIPFGPVETPELDLTATNSNGTALALADDGTAHVAWTMGGTVYHASTKLGGTSTVDKLFDLGSTVDEAGPIGRPGITLDADGNPWVAFTVETNKGREVHVSHFDGSTWNDEVAATTASCNGCASPQPTGIGVVGGAPVVVYTDANASAVMSATLAGSKWTLAPVASSVGGFGLSFASTGDTASAAYYTGSGTVELATWKDGIWSTAKVADATDPDPSMAGNLAPTTSVVVDSGGTVYVAWVDSGIQLASGTDSFSVVDLGHTVSTGTNPSLAVSDKGVALGWYETTQQNQMIGFLGDLTDVLVAQPSPSLTVSQGPPPGATCGKDKVVALDLVAQNTAFDVSCLVAPAGAAFTISFDNQEAGVPHNLDVYDAQGGTPLGATDVAPGVIKQSLKLTLDANTYYFQCDVHPTQMFGQLVVVAGAK